MSPTPVVSISAIEHHAYCPRQCALIYVDGVWVDNAHTVRGQRIHRRVDTGPARTERGRFSVRGIPLHSDRYGLVGRADLVEIVDDRTVIPVEYKGGRKHGDAAAVQLCAQALCLEEMSGLHIEFGFVWFAGPRRREKVEFDETLRAETLRRVEAIRIMLTTGSLPVPAADERCRECQLEPFCLPDVVIEPRRVVDFMAEEIFGCG